MKAKKELVRKLPPPKKVAVAPAVPAPVVAKPKKAAVLRTTADGVRLSRVLVSPEGVVLKVLN